MLNLFFLALALLRQSPADLTKRPKPPDPASGTCELRNRTLRLKSEGGPLWSLDFMPLKDDLKDLDSILLNTFSFTRE